MTTTTEHIYLIFLILVLVIGIGYWYNTSKEHFENDYTIPSTTNATTASSPTFSASINNQLSGISNTTIRTTLQTQLNILKNLLERYSTLDIPIIMNDKGQICNAWGDYAGKRYQQEQNKCVVIDNSNVPKCLDSTRQPSTCNSMLADGYINGKSNINTQPILETATSVIVNSLPQITMETERMNKIVDDIITSLSDRGSIKLQQEEIIKNNNENMVYKNTIMNDNTKKLTQKQNETNINQNIFSHSKEQITNTESTKNIYYKILIGIIIAILIMGLLNFLFSNIQ